MNKYWDKHEFADGEPIFAIEGTRKFSYWNKKEECLSYAREVDIILGTENNEHWVELKSKKWPFNKGQFGVWKLTGQKKKATIHKQFSFDWVMNHYQKKDKRAPESVSWRFHSFKSKDKKASKVASKVGHP